jgi:gas vesicle protein
MYYNDEARRFNFLSGLLCGSVLGAGLALLVAPQKGVRLRRLARRSAG